MSKKSLEHLQGAGKVLALFLGQTGFSRNAGPPMF